MTPHPEADTRKLAEQAASEIDTAWAKATGHWDPDEDPQDRVPLLTPITDIVERALQSAADAARQEGRRAALEEAARFLEQPVMIFAFQTEDIRADVIRRLRALSSPSPTNAGRPTAGMPTADSGGGSQKE